MPGQANTKRFNTQPKPRETVKQDDRTSPITQASGIMVKNDFQKTTIKIVKETEKMQKKKNLKTKTTWHGDFIGHTRHGKAWEISRLSRRQLGCKGSKAKCQMPPNGG